MPGIGVPVPGAADAVALLEQDPVANPGLVELDRRADAGEAGSDHRDLEIRLRVAAHGGTESTPPARCRSRERRRAAAAAEPAERVFERFFAFALFGFFGFLLGFLDFLATVFAKAVELFVDRLLFRLRCWPAPSPRCPPWRRRLCRRTGTRRRRGSSRRRRWAWPRRRQRCAAAASPRYSIASA